MDTPQEIKTNVLTELLTPPTILNWHKRTIREFVYCNTAIIFRINLQTDRPREDVLMRYDEELVQKFIHHRLFLQSYLIPTHIAVLFWSSAPSLNPLQPIHLPLLWIFHINKFKWVVVVVMLLCWMDTCCLTLLVNTASLVGIPCALFLSKYSLM